ncbi:hypothetical protein ABH15_03250 [Methanoculleus taiwanensis]|uniref:Uncharacterized protein n=2 Tax=Methanoculleus taiwanensis TaxID=1550565 RepID=A0A498H2J1_9EURY|nr:hypothetical protein ABH15_03250 [Methanoculleus taiwanensis]
MDDTGAPGEQRGTSVLKESRREDEVICGGSQAQPIVSSTRMHRTANGTRHCNNISIATPGDAPQKVPLYLIAHAVAAEVVRHKRRLREIHVTCTAGHYYAITTVAGKEAGSSPTPEVAE